MLRKSEKECKLLDSNYPPTVLHKPPFLEALTPPGDPLLALIPVRMLGPQQHQAALIGKHVFILNEETICTECVE